MNFHAFHLHIISIKHITKKNSKKFTLLRQRGMIIPVIEQSIYQIQRPKTISIQGFYQSFSYFKTSPPQSLPSHPSALMMFT